VVGRHIAAQCQAELALARGNARKYTELREP
jgi:hypothetical protein